MHSKITEKLKYSLLAEHASDIFRKDKIHNLLDVVTKQLTPIIAEAVEAGGNIFDQFLWMDTFYNARYPSMLFQHHLREFVEERSIVYDDDVLELFLALPIEIKTDSAVWVEAVRLLNPGIARCIDANTGYSPLTPAPVVTIGSLLGRGVRKLKCLVASQDILNSYVSPGSWPDFNKYLQYNDCIKKKFAPRSRQRA